VIAMKDFKFLFQVLFVEKQDANLEIKGHGRKEFKGSYEFTKSKKKSAV
jgi:hypothetical protein